VKENYFLWKNNFKMVYQRPITVEEICNKLRPVFGKKIDEVYLQYSMAEGREEREDIAHMLNALYHKNLNKLLDQGVLLEPPRKESVEGDYPLATVSYAGKKLYSFALRERDWPRHVCVTGMSGSGKTTFAFNIIQNFIKQDKNFLVFDWKKSFRPLIKASPEIMCITVGDDRVSNVFRTNINVPPKGVPPKEWINVLCDLLTESFSASFGVHKVLLETLDEAFKEWGIYNGSENYPTWNHIKWRLDEKMDKVKTRESGWLESAMRIATVLTFGDFGKVVNYKGEDSITVDELLDKKVLMELSALGGIEKKFFCEFILTYIYKLKKARQNTPDSKFDHAIVVDEAHNIFLKKPTHFSNESVTDMIYREMREYGTSLVCLDQHISKISDTVKGNSACHIAFQQQLPQDIFDISDLMQLRESKHFFSQLEVGTAIVKLSERYQMPFLIEVPMSPLRKENVTDADVKGRMDAILSGRAIENGEDEEFRKELVKETPKPVEERVDEPSVVEPSAVEDKMIVGFTPLQQALYGFVLKGLGEGNGLDEIETILEKNPQRNYRISDVVKVINYAFGEQLKQKRGEDSFQAVVTSKPLEIDSSEGLSEDQLKFINFLSINPDHELSTVELYNQIDLSARKGTKIKKELEEMGLISIEEKKYAKGWKKFIRLNHIHQNETNTQTPLRT
jgi:hypothetical protein